MTVILFFVILAVLVFVHEAGHFLAAKRAGVFVEEFGIGFPPRIFSWKKGETTYTLNWIPFGGFVKIAGEDGDTSGPKGRNFRDKGKFTQATILVAGVVSNFLFAWGLLSLGFMIGFPVSVEDYPAEKVNNPTLMIVGVLPDGPASLAGIKSGDQVVSAKSGPRTLTDMTPEGLQNFIVNHAGSDIAITYKRGDTTGVSTVSPKAGVAPDKVAIGVILDTVGTLSLNPFSAIVEGGRMTLRVIEAVAVGLYELVASAFKGDGTLSQISGPVGIAGVVGDARVLGFIYILSLTAFISINLGVLNLLPFPALDGGRLFFLIIEAIIRRPLDERFTRTVNTVGFLTLLLVMVLVTFKDVAKLFS